MFGKKDKYMLAAEAEAKRLRELDEKKARLLDKDMDFAFLEELVQKTNENPLLRIRITLRDGTILDIDTKPKSKPFDYIAEPTDDFLEVR